MSERLSSVEIEDVLSSIRRLVSEDLRPGAKAAGGPSAAAPAASPEAGVGKLVLTQAHRITPDAESESSQAAAGFQSVRGTRPTQASPSFEADEDEDLPPSSRPRDQAWFDLSGDEGLAEVPGPQHGQGTAGSGDERLTALSAPDDILAGEPGMAAEAGDGAFEAEPTPAATEDWLPEDEGGAAQDAFAQEAGMPEPEEPAAAPYWTRSGPEGHAAPSVAPQMGDDDWADAAEAEIRRSLEDEVNSHAFARFDTDPVDDEPHFDEEMLRDLVRDIIREELQGALGERITRNVRKLVRAEIARALAVRDFE